MMPAPVSLTCPHVPRSRLPFAATLPGRAASPTGISNLPLPRCCPDGLLTRCARGRRGGRAACSPGGPAPGYARVAALFRLTRRATSCPALRLSVRVGRVGVAVGLFGEIDHRRRRCGSAVRLADSATRRAGAYRGAVDGHPAMVIVRLPPCRPGRQLSLMVSTGRSVRNRHSTNRPPPVPQFLGQVQPPRG